MFGKNTGSVEFFHLSRTDCPNMAVRLPNGLEVDLIATYSKIISESHHDPEVTEIGRVQMLLELIGFMIDPSEALSESEESYNYMRDCVREYVLPANPMSYEDSNYEVRYKDNNYKLPTPRSFNLQVEPRIVDEPEVSPGSEDVDNV